MSSHCTIANWPSSAEAYDEVIQFEKNASYDEVIQFEKNA